LDRTLKEQLVSAYTAQVDALRRLRGGGAQHIRVEHIYLNDDAKAVIGPVNVEQKRT
jgi:hypothetical protein